MRSISGRAGWARSRSGGWPVLKARPMDPNDQVADVARTIQLAIAPVFLLTALGTMLNVFSTRLGRIVDRARVLTDRLPSAPEARRAEWVEEIEVLGQRRQLVHIAITCATSASLLMCVMIAVAFVASMLHMHSAMVIAGLFVATMVAFILALVFYLREILWAVAYARRRSDDLVRRERSSVE